MTQIPPGTSVFDDGATSGEECGYLGDGDTTGGSGNREGDAVAVEVVEGYGDLVGVGEELERRKSLSKVRLYMGGG